MTIEEINALQADVLRYSWHLKALKVDTTKLYELCRLAKIGFVYAYPAQKTDKSKGCEAESKVIKDQLSAERYGYEAVINPEGYRVTLGNTVVCEIYGMEGMTAAKNRAKIIVDALNARLEKRK